MAASVTSRRRGCNEASVVYVNPSVNPPHGVLPAPRKGAHFWCCPNSNTKPALKGEVAASATSRRRGCNEASVVYVNPSVNPPHGVLPAPRKGAPFGVVPLTKSCPRWRGKWHEVPKGVRLKTAECRELFPLSFAYAQQLPRKRWRTFGAVQTRRTVPYPFAERSFQ